MRIACVTGRLEPGRDGVGDYVRTLAAECVRQGHQVALLSVAEPAEVAAESTIAAGCPVLRLTMAQASAEGGRRAEGWLKAFGPEWTSLHFVPYSLHPRGFFAGAIPWLSTLLASAPARHVFFHEIWIGFATNASWRERIAGWWQRRAMGEMLRRIRPACAHTSNPCYRLGLARQLGLGVEELRMFGSVPREGGEAIELPEVAGDELVCGMFGALHPNWEWRRFLTALADLAAARGQRAVLVATGALRSGGALLDLVEREAGGRVRAVRTGELATPRLAAWFRRFDFAVTSVPWTLTGKSSSVAALREHGVRVVVTNAGARPRFARPGDDIEPSDVGLVPFFRGAALSDALRGRTPQRHGAAEAATEFLRALAAAGPRARRGAGGNDDV